MIQCQWATATPKRQCKCKKVHPVGESGLCRIERMARVMAGGWRKATFIYEAESVQSKVLIGARVNGRLDRNEYSYRLGQTQSVEEGGGTRDERVKFGLDGNGTPPSLVVGDTVGDGR